jgi:hypothetical protein
MRGPENMSMPIFFICTQKIRLVLLGDRNFGIRIALRAALVRLWCKAGLGMKLGLYHSWVSHQHHAPSLGQVTSSSQAQTCGTPLLLPCMCVHLFASPPHPFSEEWQWVTACCYTAGCSSGNSGCELGPSNELP